jgi:hypothetical protein
MTPFGWFGKQETSGLTPEEANVYERLCRNREAAAAELPPGIRRDFLNAVFPRPELRDIVLSTFREPGVAGNRSGWLADCLAARFGKKDFGARLVTEHRLNPDDVLEMMLSGCDADAVPPGS